MNAGARHGFAGRRRHFPGALQRLPERSGDDAAPGSQTHFSLRQFGAADYHAKGVLYLPEEARFGHLLQLPEGGNIGQAVTDAMRAVEKENPDLADVLPKTYQILEPDRGRQYPCSARIVGRREFGYGQMNIKA